MVKTAHVLRTRILLLLSIVALAPNRAAHAADPPEQSATAAAKSALRPPHAGSTTGESWSDNRLKLEFLWCEPGKFVMGSPKDEPGRSEDEDQVDVTLTHGFWLGKYEVTQEQWRTVMQTEPWQGMQRVRVAADSPACWLSWDQASLFCRELTRQERESGALPEGWEYVLPTEAQWEYACRAGTTTMFFFGDDDSKLFDYAWYGEQERGAKEMNARAVGRKLPNPWGFYDMHGNVVEWCRDWYNPKYPGGSDPYVGTDFNNRVTARGGEWRIELRWSRSACRQNLLPAGRGATIGLRVSLQQGNTTEIAPSPTVRLAVISFENRGKSVAHSRFGTALAGMVASDLAQFAELEVLERQAAQDLTNESGLAQAGLAPGSTANSQKQSATYMLTGASAVNGQKLQVTAKLAQPGFPKPVAEWNLTGDVDDLFRLEAELTAKVVAALKIKPEKRRAPPALRGAAPVMAILPLANNSATARLDEMQTAFAELLQASLGAIPGVRLVERQKLDTIIAEQKLSLSGLVDPATAVQIGKLAGAQRLLTGSYLELGDQLNLQVRIVDTATGGVVGSARATHSSKEFAELLEDLTSQVTSELAIAVQPDAERAPAPVVGRTLESTVHRSEAERYRKTGNLTKAAEAYQQALLIEPYSIYLHQGLIRVQVDLQDYAGAIRTGEHGLQQTAEFERDIYKPFLLSPLVYAYQQTGRLDAIQNLLAKYGDVADDFRYYATLSLANGLIQEKRFPEATSAMEKMAEQDVAKHGVLKSEGLRQLFAFHAYHSTSVVGIPIKVHQDQARKAIAIYERVLDAAKGAQDDDAVKWAHAIIPRALDLITISDANQRVAFLNASQQADYRKRQAEVFGWLPDVGLDAAWDVALKSEGQQAWDAALKAYRQFLELSEGVSGQYVYPVSFNEDWINKRIEAQYRVGRILGFELDREAEAPQAFETLVRECGLSHGAGPDTRVAMHRLKIDAQIPPETALVIGGNTSNLNGWKILLGAEDLRVHALRRMSIGSLSIGDLAPYRVVIFARGFGTPLTPSEVLALRTYVAAGGSLLVIASPMWSPAGAVADNALLSLFDMEAEAGAIGSARATQIVAHPITEGITEFTAQQGAGLRAPPDTVLVRTGDKALLAARAYGRGRLVVATIGQWHTPEILLVPEITAAPPRKVIVTGQNTENYEYIRGLSPEPPLLRQSLHWLREPRKDEASFAEWRKEWQSSVESFVRAQARIMPPEDRIVDWTDLPGIFDRLVADAPNPEFKELSLWTAGECLLEKGYYNFDALPVGYQAQRGPLGSPKAGRRLSDFNLQLDPKYFQRLVDDFADSPLLPYARFRLADTKQLRENPLNDHNFNPQFVELVTSLAAPYEKFTFEPGTYAHAWANLHAGELYFVIDDLERAAKHFEAVAEAMPVSAEKAVAVYNLSKCRLLQADYPSARRLLGQLRAMPNFDCREGYEDFMAQSEASRFLNDRFRAPFDVLSQGMMEEIPKLETNQEFKKWRAKRKQGPSKAAK